MPCLEMLAAQCSGQIAKYFNLFLDFKLFQKIILKQFYFPAFPILKLKKK